MPAAPQAKFEFVATGDAAVNAQIEGVVNKLVRMKQQAMEAGHAGSEGMLSANESAKLLNESLELHMPRALTKVISGFQSLQGIIIGLGVGGAFLAGAEVAFRLGTEIHDLYDKWLNVDEAVDAYNKSLAEAVTKSAQNVSSIEEAGNNFRFLTGELDKYQAKRESLNKHNKQTSITQDPLDYFFSKSDEKEAATGQFNSKLALFNTEKALLDEQSKATDTLIGQEKQLNDIRLEGMPKILADERSDIAAADAKLDKLQRMAELENKRRSEYNAANPTKQVALIPDDIGQIEHATALFYAHADAGLKVAKAYKEASEAVQNFENTLAALRGEAAVAAEDDPYQKELTSLDNHWQTRIRTTMDKGEKELDLLRKQGVNTTELEKELDETLLALYQAYMKEKEDLVKKQTQQMLSGGLPQGQIPSALFVTNDDNINRNKADELIKRVTASLQDEAAQEALLKDRAATTGETQIALETEQLALRTKTAAQLQGLADSLLAVGKAMHDGLGDPTVIAQAEKLEAKLDTLRMKTMTWQIEFKKTIFGDLESGFAGVVSGTETVSQAFQKMGQDIIAALAKVIFQLYIVKLLEAGISALGFGKSGGGSSGGGQIFDSSFFPNVTPHAMGGPVMPGQTYLVGERGPELMRFGGSGYITPNSQMGGAPPVQVNIHNYGQPMEQQQSSHFDGQQYVVDVVIKDIQSNGPIRQALR